MTLSASKIKDITEAEKAKLPYKKIKHNHKDSITCLRCNMNNREKELKDKIKNMNDNSTTKLFDLKGNITGTAKIGMLKVKRDRIGDIVGYIWEWTG